MLQQPQLQQPQPLQQPLPVHPETSRGGRCSIPPLLLKSAKRGVLKVRGYTFHKVLGKFSADLTLPKVQGPHALPCSCPGRTLKRSAATGQSAQAVCDRERGSHLCG